MSRINFGAKPNMYPLPVLIIQNKNRTLRCRMVFVGTKCCISTLNFFLIFRCTVKVKYWHTFISSCFVFRNITILPQTF